MRAHLERFTRGGGCLRAGPDGWMFGDPDYTFSCAVDWIAHDEVELKGAVGTVTCALRDAVRAALAAHGLRVFWIARHRRNGTTTRTPFSVRGQNRG